MNEIGHNKPPDMTVTAGEVTRDLSDWMREHPIVQTETEAKEAKVWLDRANLCVKDMEDERKAQTGPLNEAIKKINENYRGPRELLERVSKELRFRVDWFLGALERQRERDAETARLDSERLADVAREAERRESDALRNAASGELGLDVARAGAEADAAFADYQAAERQAAILERATKVKVTGGFGRALSLRTVEVPYVYEPIKVVADLEENKMITEKLMEAILSAANNFKRKFGRLANGMRVDTERRS